MQDSAVPLGRPSPLHDVQERHGATFVDWQGRSWVRDFGDSLGEHFAVREDVGVWDVSNLHAWELRGPDAARAADRRFTNAVAEAQAGQIRYGLLCDERGAIHNDATVFRHDARGHRLWVFSSLRGDEEHLRRGCAGLDAEVGRLDELAVVQVQGPRSWALLATLAPGLAPLAFLRFHPTPVGVAGVTCLLARIGFSGELGFELLCRSQDAEALWLRLIGAGARPYGFAAVHTLRVESGLLLLGEDLIAGRTTPYDVSLDGVVRPDKPELEGGAALAALAADPPRRLVCLALEGGVVPVRGAPVLVEGARVGEVTSACMSPTLRRVLALASVGSGHTGLDLVVRVAIDRGRSARGRVTTLPAYDPAKARLRADVSG